MSTNPPPPPNEQYAKSRANATGFSPSSSSLATGGSKEREYFAPSNAQTPMRSTSSPQQHHRARKDQSPVSSSSEFEDYEEEDDEQEGEESSSNAGAMNANWQMFNGMKEAVMQTLKSKGVLGKIRAELQAAVVTAIDEDERQQGIHGENPRLKLLESDTTGPILVELVRDFLENLGLDNTKSCFESEISNVSVRCEVLPVMLEFLLDGVDSFMLTVLGASKGTKPTGTAREP
eukprot:gb/GECG01010969.1/.p1 GENE.gb/GECG01010969.1/~~gb/GECG01010969.1/.p1  ORF type:complete len:233 (+),score=48.63 gb/GECG01010969.1/:1-699(+)